MTRIFIITLLIISSLSVKAQGRMWTVDECIDYAVTHNHDVRLQRMQIDDYRTDKQRAVGAFLPSVEGSVGGQFNFGRAIDPETNTYTNVNTFYNNYGVSASVPLFDGLQRYNDLRMAQANLLMGRQGLVAQKDRVAQQVLKAYLDVLYYQTALDYVKQKREESAMLLHQTKVMVEVGTKGEADVAQMEATFASDDYEVTRQQGLLSQSLLRLKEQMNYPAEEALDIVADAAKCMQPSGRGADALPCEELMPTIRQAEYQLQSARYAYRSSKGALLPSLFVGAGLSTTYFKQMGVTSSQTFANQFRNNAGEYVYASLSIPLFNRLSTLSSIRRHRNNVERARENLDNERQVLRRLIQETTIDQQNSWMEMQKMKEKVEADSMAAQFTIRKYQEGISSSIDVQTATVSLLQSKAQLLQCQLSYLYQTRIMDYYKGIPLWTESSKRKKD